MTRTTHDPTRPLPGLILAVLILAAAAGACRDAPAEPPDGATPTAAADATAVATPDGASDAADGALEPVPALAAALAFHPSDVDRAWFTLERGLVTTTDGGLNWAVVEGLKAETSQRFFLMTVHGGVQFAGGDGLLLVSEDDGVTWAPVAQHGDADVRGLATDPADSARLLALIAGTGLVATVDGGATWQPVASNVPELAYGLWALSLDPPRLVTVDRADGTLHISNDGGGAWAPFATTGLEGEILGFAPGDGIAYAATHIGLFVSEDGGATWVPRGPFKALITVASAPNDRDTVLVVVPGGQVFRSRDRGMDWFDPNAPTRTPTVEATATGIAIGTDGAGESETGPGGVETPTVPATVP